MKHFQAKSQTLSNNTSINANIDQQVIFLSKEGYIISSTGSLFSTKNLQKKTVFSWSPFMESIFHQLLQRPYDQITKFVKVKTIHSFLPGVYDYAFVKLPPHIASQGDLLWIISDRTNCYNKMEELQQIAHEETRLRAK